MIALQWGLWLQHVLLHFGKLWWKSVVCLVDLCDLPQLDTSLLTNTGKTVLLKVMKCFIQENKNRFSNFFSLSLTLHSLQDSTTCCSTTRNSRNRQREICMSVVSVQFYSNTLMKKKNKEKCLHSCVTEFSSLLLFAVRLIFLKSINQNHSVIALKKYERKKLNQNIHLQQLILEIQLFSLFKQNLNKIKIRVKNQIIS